MVFGGLCKENGALNDLWLFDMIEKTWRQINFEGSGPPGRLDACACIVRNLFATQSNETTKQAGDFLLITGGMNTEGDVFSDCFLFRLDEICCDAPENP